MAIFEFALGVLLDIRSMLSGKPRWLRYLVRGLVAGTAVAVIVACVYGTMLMFGAAG